MSETDQLRAVLDQNANFQKALSRHFEEGEGETKKLQEKHSLIAHVMGLEGMDPLEAAKKREDEVVEKLRLGVRPHPAKSRYRSFDEEDEHERREHVEKEIKRKSRRDPSAETPTSNVFQTVAVTERLSIRNWDEDDKHINERTGRRKKKGKNQKDEDSEYEPISHDEMHLIVKGIQSGELNFTDETPLSSHLISTIPTKANPTTFNPTAELVSFLESNEVNLPRGQSRKSASPIRSPSFAPTRQPTHPSPQPMHSTPQPIRTTAQPTQPAPQPIHPTPQVQSQAQPTTQDAPPAKSSSQPTNPSAKPSQPSHATTSNPTTPAPIVDEGNRRNSNKKDVSKSKKSKRGK